jgi:hypothetical protein
MAMMQQAVEHGTNGGHIRVALLGERRQSLSTGVFQQHPWLATSLPGARSGKNLFQKKLYPASL